LFIFSLSLIMLWEAWDKERRPKPPAQAPAVAPAAVPAAKATAQQAVPAAPVAQRPADANVPGAVSPAAKGETIQVRTDLMVAHIDTVGATLKRLEKRKTRRATLY
jgi:YidC/Oxa1 family membrane protein insertase